MTTPNPPRLSDGTVIDASVLRRLAEQIGVTKQHEPLAWMTADEGNIRQRVITSITKADMPHAVAQPYVVPLYAAPQAADSRISDQGILDRANNHLVDDPAEADHYFFSQGELIDFARALLAGGKHGD
jgi:hypothetical protein